MYNLWMSLNLEYLPLFIFVLTLTYKKKKGKRTTIKKKINPTTKRMFGRWRRDGRSAPLSPQHGAWVLGLCGTQALIHGCRGGTRAIGVQASVRSASGPGVGHRFCAVVGTSHQAIGPFLILCSCVTRRQLSGPEGNLEKLVYFVWFQ